MAGDRALIILGIPRPAETSQGCPEPRPFPSTECGAWLESCSRSVLARSYGRVGWAFGLERRLEHDGEGLKSASSGAWPGRAPKVTKSVGCRWRLELPGARHPELLCLQCTDRIDARGKVLAFARARLDNRLIEEYRLLGMCFAQVFGKSDISSPIHRRSAAFFGCRLALGCDRSSRLSVDL